MSTTVHFSIKYDGPALQSHQMDVRELGPALLALAGLLEDANKAAYPDGEAVRVSVQGNFKGGSFGVDLIAVQSMASQIVSMLTSPGASAASNLSGILQGLGLVAGATAAAGAGLIGLIKWLGGRKPTSVKTLGDSEIYEIRTQDAVETMAVDLIAGRLYRSRAVRTSLLKVLKPLENEGIDYFASGQDGQAENIITKDQLPAFVSAAQGEEALSNSLLERVVVQVESPVFKDGNKWRLNDGQGAFFCAIEDQEFLNRVEAGAERFGKGDVLLADLRRYQLIGDSGLRVEYTLIKVHEHREPLQRPLI